MPNESQHHTKALRNRDFLNTISIDDYPDWGAVVAFYIGVHLVEELRAALGDGDSTGHDDRLGYVQHAHPDVHTAYHILQNVSMLCRYESNSDVFRQIQPQRVRDLLIGRYLGEIEAYVQKRVAK